MISKKTSQQAQGIDIISEVPITATRAPKRQEPMTEKKNNKNDWHAILTLQRQQVEAIKAQKKENKMRWQ